ncbi:MAG: hypothetical protein BWY41_01111 [Candidatus Atribacteria bacterium ADurb.Bin276]|uniref:Uncharacterized protein n=1 Tax=Candidatus Atribacter allofermentans TaxID=1852833 RepID=A0A1V5SV33_9BACT|nr:MAG: hypothetical protein BWY41_01111 [Candidatus Atribacteria bacterium ADurb.Bin276]
MSTAEAVVAIAFIVMVFLAPIIRDWVNRR